MSVRSVAGSKVLVTGAAGFIGYHLAQQLLGSGADVCGLDNLNDYYDVALKQARLSRLNSRSGFRFEKLDLVDFEAVQGLLAEWQPNFIVHLAAQAGVRYSITHPRSYIRSNVDGFLSILEACRHVPVEHLLYASSSSVYGSNTKVPFHEDDPVSSPVSLYAATKRSNELMAQTYAHLYGVRCSGLRFFTVYGPWGRPDMAYYSFTRAISEGQPIDVYNHGRMQRDFTYIDDVIIAVERLLERPPAAVGADDQKLTPHTIYNIGNHTPIELSRFIAAIESALSMQAEKHYLPMQPGDVSVTYADVQRLSEVTGFAPQTTIEDGISRFVEWYRTHHGDTRAAL